MDASTELRLLEPEHETATPDAIRALQLRRVRELLAAADATNDFYRAHWRAAGAGDVATIDSLEAFAARIPTVGKADFLADQQLDPPFGRRHAHARAQGVALYVSTTSGTSGQGQEVHIQTQREWDAMGRVYRYLHRWAGLNAGDGLALALPLTMLGGGRLEYHGALSYGLSVYPIGNYDAARKTETIRRFQPAAVMGITAYLGRLGHELAGDPPPGMRAVLTGGEGAGVEWLKRLEQAWGAPVFDRYGSSQAGNDHMFTCEHGIGTVERPGVLHNIDPEVLLEVVDPETGRHVDDGEVGELIVTILYRHDAPIIRCRMGDRAVYRAPGSCPCGRPFMGVEVASIGRADDMRKIKGVNVWPQAVDDVVFEHEAVAEYQVVLSSGGGGNDLATLRAMPEAGLDDEAARALAGALTRDVERRIGIRFDVELVAPGELAHGDWKARRWIDQRDHVAGAAAGAATRDEGPAA
jgi:phenylacetate-CoA ligase